MPVHAFTLALGMYPAPHQRLPEHRAFEAELAWYLANGYVHAEPKSFIMFCAIGREAWYIHTAVGPRAVERVTELLPYPLPRLVWEGVRGGRVRRYSCRWERISALLKLATKTGADHG